MKSLARQHLVFCLWSRTLWLRDLPTPQQQRLWLYRCSPLNDSQTKRQSYQERPAWRPDAGAIAPGRWVNQYLRSFNGRRSYTGSHPCPGRCQVGREGWPSLLLSEAQIEGRNLNQKDGRFWCLRITQVWRSLKIKDCKKIMKKWMATSAHLKARVTPSKKSSKSL